MKTLVAATALAFVLAWFKLFFGLLEHHNLHPLSLATAAHSRDEPPTPAPTPADSATTMNDDNLGPLGHIALWHVLGRTRSRSTQSFATDSQAPSSVEEPFYPFDTFDIDRPRLRRPPYGHSRGAHSYRGNIPSVQRHNAPPSTALRPSSPSYLGSSSGDHVPSAPRPSSPSSSARSSSSFPSSVQWSSGRSGSSRGRRRERKRRHFRKRVSGREAEEAAEPNRLGSHRRGSFSLRERSHLRRSSELVSFRPR
jgi:hypothetical protein